MVLAFDKCRSCLCMQAMWSDYQVGGIRSTGPANLGNHVLRIQLLADILWIAISLRELYNTCW